MRIKILYIRSMLSETELVITESKLVFYPGWTSQLTTPCATPYLSVDSLSPRTMSSGWEDALPWSALSSTTQDRSTSWLPTDRDR